MSLFKTVSTFARSPQGRQALAQAQKLAKDPNTKRKIAEARQKLQNRGGGTPPR